MNKSMPELLHIEELEGEECLRLRPLWEEVFWEDSEEFTDYYFKEKAARNHGIVLKAGEETVSMLYLSPYPVMLRTGSCFTEWEINYIVGVATREKYRHRGYMDRILRRALALMRERRQPFTFLMPADPAIYRSYQFDYIYEKEIYLIKEKSKKDISEGKMAFAQDFQMLAEFASFRLTENYDVFIRRDAAYYQGMEKELEVQNGGIFPLYGKDRAIEGYFLYTEEEGKGEVQEAVLDGKGEECPVYLSGNRQLVIMARITDVQSMLSLLRTEGTEFIWSVKIEDEILHENSGIWKCRIGPDKAYICKNGRDNLCFECETDICRLAGWIFGCRREEDCFAFPAGADKEAVLRKIREIRKMSRVFINEIV